ncbi:MAG: manganese efflux pump MntP family protein [Candidatus Aureabacteria bacterium]|nr:manganese efflux pump MntP family protein [Candidatus Auribacterota bacterium]
MNTIVLFAIAFALAMDAFAVSMAIALSLKNPSHRQTLRLAFSFGLFQFMMPVIGWLAGRGLMSYIRGFDHWIAFALLVFIGGKMIRESAIVGHEDDEGESDPTTGVSLLILSIATSIDALAVGLSLSLIKVEIMLPSVVIGIVAFLMTAIGMRIGPLAGRLFGKRAEIAGGLILVAIGVKILLEHLCG